MHLLTKTGRCALLTFLRNLTPQAFLITITLILYAKWRATGSNLDAALVVCTLFIILMAFMANVDEFLENSFSYADEISNRISEIKEHEPSVFKRILSSISFIGKDRPIVLFELIVAFFVIYISMIVVLYSAAQAAVNALT